MAARSLREEEMRIYCRYENGPFWADFWHDGRRVRKSTGTFDKAQAREWADRYKSDLWREDRLGERPAITWDTAVLDWLADNGTLTSIADRKDQLRWTSKYLSGRPLASIDAKTLTDLARRKAAEGVKPATVNRHLAAISAVLHHAHGQGHMDAVPAIPRRSEPSKRVRWATEEQAAKLIAALPPEWSVQAAFSLATGLRKHNVTHLRWEAVNLKRKTVWVNPDEAKAAAMILVPLSDDAIGILLGQKGKHAEYVFTGRRRTPVSRIEAKVWSAACKAAGLPSFRWHDLRHTWASWHAQRGTPLPVLKELGGWKTLSMVMRYAHQGASHLAAYANNGSMSPNRSLQCPESDGEKAA